MRRFASSPALIFIAVAVAVSGAFALRPPAALAQTYPSKPVRFLVPFAPAGSADIMARVGKRLSDALGQPLLIENQGGGGGTLATEALARSAPDGYTVALGSLSTLVLAPLLNPSGVRYDPVKSFAHISMIATAATVLIVSQGVPADNLRELIELAKARPGALNYGSNGVGALPHLAAELFRAMTGTQWAHVPYKGAGPVTNALLAGEIQMGIIVPAGIEQHLKSGRLRALAVAGPRRLPSLPQVPTAAEAGLPGFETYTWFGLTAAQGTPATVVSRLNSEVGKATAAKDLQEVLTAQGLEAGASTPQQLLQLVGTETEKWAGIIKSAGIKVE